MSPKLNHPVTVFQAEVANVPILYAASPSPKPNQPVTVFHAVSANVPILYATSVPKLNQVFTASHANVPNAEMLKSNPVNPNQPVTVAHAVVPRALILNVLSGPKDNHPLTVSQALVNSPPMPDVRELKTSAPKVNPATNRSHAPDTKFLSACAPKNAVIATAIPAGTASTGATIAAANPAIPPTNSAPHGILRSTISQALAIAPPNIPPMSIGLPSSPLPLNKFANA